MESLRILINAVGVGHCLRQHGVGAWPWSARHSPLAFPNNAADEKQEPQIPSAFPLNTGANLLLLLDGYDELTTDAAIQPLWVQLGLASLPLEWQSRIKLVVTCGRQVVPRGELEARFTATAAGSGSGNGSSS